MYERKTQDVVKIMYRYKGSGLGWECIDTYPRTKEGKSEARKMLFAYNQGDTDPMSEYKLVMGRIRR